jgi:uncharacterized protein YukE
MVLPASQYGLRVEEYTQLRESTPSPLHNIQQRRWHGRASPLHNIQQRRWHGRASPLHNIQQRRWHGRASNDRLYNTEDHNTYQHDLPHNVPVDTATL